MLLTTAKLTSEHIGISYLTRERIECKPYVVSDHLLRHNHGFRLLLKES